MNQQKACQVLKILDQHQTEEHLPDTWLYIINQQLPKNKKLKNTRTLMNIIYTLIKKGAEIKKNKTSIYIGKPTTPATFYKYK